MINSNTVNKQLNEIILQIVRKTMSCYNRKEIYNYKRTINQTIEGITHYNGNCEQSQSKVKTKVSAEDADETLS